MRRTSMLLVLLVVSLGGCALLTEQTRVANQSSCVQKACGHEPDANGYARCESACRSAYGR